MLNVTDYTILTKIYQGEKTTVYRGYRNQDQLPVIIKTLEHHYGDTQKVAQFHHEYEITKDLNLTGIIKPYGLQKFQHTWLLILEDIHGDSLKNILAHQTLDLLTGLQIAIQLADNLGELQAHQIIHKDLKPANIIVNLKTGQVKLTDFSISVRRSSEPQLFNQSFLEGTLTYMSPEQTGRMNRVLDYRTDFYSLGVVLYEMLVGRPPFQSGDPMELVHCHLAKRPIPPHKINHQVPKAISHLVMKLLSKTAEGRYQTAAGLKADLTHCVQQLQALGHIDEFLCGKQDISDQFQISQKLYGRDQELGKLLQAFEHVKHGALEIIFVTGDAGVGKSSVIKELWKPVVQQRGYFVVGKFDQRHRTVPYHTWIQTIRELLAQILTDSEDQLARFQTLLLNALGPYANLLVSVLPELEIILGRKSSAETQFVPKEATSLDDTFPTSEESNHVNLAFRQIIRLFAQPQHPLVIFLDDFQYADPASLKLLETLVTDTATASLLLVVAYQEHELTTTPSLRQTLVKLQEAELMVDHLHLASWNVASVTQLVIDTVHCDSARAFPLADLILRKTDGNPFFVKEFLKTLYHHQLLHFDTLKKIWVWDLNQIQYATITDNVVDFLVCQLQELPSTTQQVLKLAACIGNEFDLFTLSWLAGLSPLETTQALLPILETHLCVPIDDTHDCTTLPLPSVPLPSGIEDNIYAEATGINFSQYRYRFSHQRIQQAAYSLLAEHDQAALHYRIGCLWLGNKVTADELEKHLFEIVHHFNQGQKLIRLVPELMLLVALNLRAGRKAREAVAYDLAWHYFHTALTFLPADSWKQYYPLTLAVHLDSMQTAYLNADFAKANELANTVLQQAQTILDTIKVYEAKMAFAISQNQMSEAIETALETLSQLGIALTHQPPTLNIAQFRQLPELTDPVALAALRILMTMIPATYITNPQLFPAVIFTMLDLSVHYGNTAISAVGYACYGLLLCGNTNDILHSPLSTKMGVEAGQFALQLLKQWPASKKLQPRIYQVVYGHIQPWQEHLKTTLEPLQQAIDTGIDSGEIEYAGYSILIYCNHLFFTGEPLDQVAKKHQQYLELMQQFKQSFPVYYLTLWQQTISKLLGQPNLSSKDFSAAEEDTLSVLRDAHNRTSLFTFHLNKCFLNYLFKNFEQAIEQAKLAKQEEASVLGLVLVAELNFYYSLALLAHAKQTDSSLFYDHIKRVKNNQALLQQWAHSAPMNYRHKYQLVAAELARLQGQVTSAMSLYEQAIAGAQREGYLHEMALANELAAEFYFSLGHAKIAKLYLAEAHSAYLQWGSQAKVRELQKQHSLLTSRPIEPSKPPHTHTTTVTATTLSSESSLDLATIIKASQTLSSEIVPDNLIKKLMYIVLENTGASEGWLIGVQQGRFVLLAYATLEGVQIVNSLPLDTVENTPQALSKTVVQYVARTQTPLLLNHAADHPLFANDPYILQKQPKSLLCLPVLNKNQLISIISLENNLTTGAFTQDRLTVLTLLSTQIAISLENASYYAKLEQARQQAEQAQQKAEQARQDAETASRAKSTFLAKMSHELRTPLNAILGYSDLINEDAKELGYQNILPDLEKIQKAGKHLLGIISNILDISKIEADKLDLTLSEFTVTDLIDEVVSTIQPIVNLDGNLLLIKPSPELGTLYADRHKVVQILLNLLSNATKFTHHGTLTVTISRKPLLGSATGERDWFFFQIADTGIGIPQDQMNQIFEAFIQADNSSTRRYEGAGLGLTVSEYFCKAMGGNISLASELGKGSIFTVQLPAYVHVQAHESMPSSGSSRIKMVVD